MVSWLRRVPAIGVLVHESCPFRVYDGTICLAVRKTRVVSSLFCISLLEVRHRIRAFKLTSFPFEEK